MNYKRSRWAEAAVGEFTRHTFLNPATEDMQTIIGDLLCDLHHYTDQIGVDFNVALDAADSHYRYEVEHPDE